MNWSRTVSGVPKRPEDVDLPRTVQRPSSTPTALYQVRVAGRHRLDRRRQESDVSSPEQSRRRPEENVTAPAQQRPVQKERPTQRRYSQTTICHARPSNNSVAAFVHHYYLGYYLRRSQLFTARLLSFAGVNYIRLLFFTGFTTLSHDGH